MPRAAWPRLYLSHIAELDRLVALEYGRADDGQPAECWRRPASASATRTTGPRGPELGSKVFGLPGLEMESDALAEIWGEPRFDVPVLG